MLKLLLKKNLRLLFTLGHFAGYGEECFSKCGEVFWSNFNLTQFFRFVSKGLHVGSCKA